MADEYIEHDYQWFRCKNLKYKDTDYLLERNTLKTKKGDGIHYYNDLPYTIVTVTGNNIPVSAGGIPTSGTNGTFKPIPFTGVIDGSNPTFTLSNSATDVMVISDTQPLLIGLGYTVAGLVYTIINPPVNGIVFYGNY